MARTQIDLLKGSILKVMIAFAIPFLVSNIFQQLYNTVDTIIVINNQKIMEVMTSDIKYATPDMDVHAVADLMAENQVRRLPVIDNDKLVGIVAIGDLAVENIFENEAGEALHNISMGVRH